MNEVAADERKMGPTWTWSPAQKTMLRNLFKHQKLLLRLISHEFRSLDEARSTLIHAHNLMKRKTPNMFSSEMGWHIYSRRDSKTEAWGIAPPNIGLRGSVEAFDIGTGLPERRAQVASTKKTGEFLHNHPDEPGSVVPLLMEKLFGTKASEFRAGFSLGDLLGALKAETPILVYHEGASFRLSLNDGWFKKQISWRQSVVIQFEQMLKKKRLNIAEVKYVLDLLLPYLTMQQIGPLPKNRLMDARPIADLKPHKLGPNATDVPLLPLLPAPPGVLEAEKPRNRSNTR
jgi:hypothetical protein